MAKQKPTVTPKNMHTIRPDEMDRGQVSTLVPSEVPTRYTREEAARVCLTCADCGYVADHGGDYRRHRREMHRAGQRPADPEETGDLVDLLAGER